MYIINTIDPEYQGQISVNIHKWLRLNDKAHDDKQMFVSIKMAKMVCHNHQVDIVFREMDKF